MFKIGQKVVAKNFNAPNGCYPFGIVKGKIYEVESIDDCEAGHGICLVGVDSGSKKNCYCGKTHESNSFMAWRFEPLKYNLMSNKSIISEIIKEKIDIETTMPIEV